MPNFAVHDPASKWPFGYLLLLVLSRLSDLFKVLVLPAEAVLLRSVCAALSTVGGSFTLRPGLPTVWGGKWQSDLNVHHLPGLR